MDGITNRYSIHEVKQDKRFLVKIETGHISSCRVFKFADSSHLSLRAAFDQIVRLQREHKVSNEKIFNTVSIYGPEEKLIRNIEIYA